MRTEYKEMIRGVRAHAVPRQEWRKRIGGVCALLLAATVISAQTTEVTLFSFGEVYPRGLNPWGGLTRDAEGNFYGTAGGGKDGAGLVFKLDKAGHKSVLYTFTGGADGGGPTGVLMRDSAGNLYGATSGGGSAGGGVVFKVDTTGLESVVYNFTGGADGGSPSGGVVSDSAGNLYGTTCCGGSTGSGVVYKIDTTGQETALYSFTGGADGAYPGGGVILDSAGNLYGTTCCAGGPAWGGTVFMVDPAGNETTLYTFNCAADGCNPNAGLTRDSAGNLYGTTAYGGAPGAGNVFKLDTSGNETSLYSFTGGPDGGYPASGVILDRAGNLYGTTANGGNTSASNCGYYGPGCGVVYRVSPAGDESVLYTFTGGTDGNFPNAGLARDSAGDLYGTTVNGGAAGNGVVFKVDTSLTESVLYGFPAGRSVGDGVQPHGMVRDSAGNLYGADSWGGSSNLGILFKLDTNRRLTVLHTFTGGADGGNPASLALDAAGNLYGTSGGGAAGKGVLFKSDTNGNLTVLHSFTGGADGGNPNSPVVLDSAGNIYGTTSAGGNTAACPPNGCGVVYKMDPAGNETIIYSFVGGTGDGSGPSNAALFRDSDGTLYGTTGCCGGAGGLGTVFKIDSRGKETVLYNFSAGVNEGAGAPGGVIRDKAGNLYGTANGCSGACWGMLYRLEPSGILTVLHYFTNGADGAFPNPGLIRDEAGNLYGTTWEHQGSVFKLDTAGNLTTLSGSAGNPTGGVIRDQAGHLYGSGINGGKYGGGFIFELH